MKLPLTPRFSTLADIASWASGLASSIAAGWNIEHRPDGRHNFRGSDVSFRASDFFADNAMTWTVERADVQSFRRTMIGYYLMKIDFEVAGGVVGGTPDAELRLQIPDNRVVNGRQEGTFVYIDSGTGGTGLWYAIHGESFVRLYRDYSGTVWTAAGNTVAGQMFIEVQ